MIKTTGRIRDRIIGHYGGAATVTSGGGSSTFNQFVSFGEVTGPTSYSTGGFTLDLSATYSSLNDVELAVKTVGANLPVAHYEYSLAAGVATIKIMRHRYDRVTTVGNVTGQPSGVTVQGASGADSTNDIVDDAFTRADSTSSLGTSTSGHVWTAQAGTWGISSNQAYMVTTTLAGHATVDSLVTDGSVSVDITTTSAADRTFRGFVVRWVDSSNYILAHIRDTGSGSVDRIFRLTKVEAGVATNLATSSTASWTPGDTFNLRCDYMGDVLVLYKDTTAMATYTMTAGEVALYNASTVVGLYINADAALDDNLGRLDNFNVGPAHYHSIAHDHAAFASGINNAAGGAVLLDTLGPALEQHTHNLNLANFTGSSGTELAHLHEDNSLYQHQHAITHVAENMASVELGATTDLSGTVWYWAATGVRL